MKNNRNSTGIGFCGVLAIAFIVLKLIGVISWKWLWVLAPIWIPAGLVITFFLIGLIFNVIGVLISAMSDD